MATGTSGTLRVDLNSDLGESFGAYTIGNDGQVVPVVSSVNVACGMHAGDPGVMRATVALAAKHGVAVGAHPGYPDLQGFGRRDMALSPAGGLRLRAVSNWGARCLLPRRRR